MLQKSPVVHSLGHAILIVLYIWGVVSLMQHAEKFFGPNETLIGIGMLLLFVISATIVGGLVLGRPIVLYFENKKKEAIQFLMITVGWLLLFVITVFALLAEYRI